MMSLVQAAGETEKLVQGLFENYLDCKFKDPYMDGVRIGDLLAPDYDVIFSLDREIL